MEKYDVHDKYGNKIGTFEPSFGCDCDELMTIVALLGFVRIAAGIGAILVPIAVIDTFVESALEGWRTPPVCPDSNAGGRSKTGPTNAGKQCGG